MRFPFVSDQINFLTLLIISQFKKKLTIFVTPRQANKEGIESRKEEEKIILQQYMHSINLIMQT